MDQLHVLEVRTITIVVIKCLCGEDMSAVFKAAYPTTFCIIDATELMCEVPASLHLQS